MDKHEHLREVSQNTLNVFELIESKATLSLQNGRDISTDALVSGNSITGSRAAGNMQDITSSVKKGYQALKGEPAIARIVAEDEDGNLKTYYISRSTSVPLEGGAALASYNSAIGRLASLPVGDEHSLVIQGKPQQFYVVEKMGLRPDKAESVWDSKPSLFEHEELGTLTIESMLALLRGSEPNAADDLDALLSGGEPGDGVIEGVAHQARLAMSLRDQPVLDQFQDDIFRLPIDSQLLILGPPGTGKTTTLIKRLGHKLDIQHLDEGDKRFAVEDSAGLAHQRSWLMFTPTELLKHYVKEAFSREQVPAPNERIQTWDAYRNNLARNVMSILQSTTYKSGFILKASQSHVQEDVDLDPRAFFEALSLHHQMRMLDQLKAGIKLLESVDKPTESALIARLAEAVAAINTSNLVSSYGSLLALEAEVSPRIKTLKTETDLLIRKGLNFEFNKNKKFLNELADHLKANSVEDDSDDDEQFDEEATEEVSATHNEVQQAALEYTKAIRSLARAKFLKRSVPKASKAALIRDWLGDRLPSEKVFDDIGLNIVTQNGLRRFVSPMKRYVTTVPASYSAFRKSAFKKGQYFKSLPSNNKHIGALELDAVILLVLTVSRQLLGQSFVSRNMSDTSMSWLELLSSHFKNQILVDEVTDFSALQIAAMANLTQMKGRSFFACGDFNQRITSAGVRTQEQFEWACPDIKRISIVNVYRQSKRLNDFSRRLLEQTGGDTEALGQLPESYNHPGFSPVLAEGLSETGDVARWLFERISEVEKASRTMPTVAVLVNSEDQVLPVADALAEYLEDINLKAVPCLQGQMLGEGTDVRVFNVEHIKGLEFEAVFFAGIDDLALELPDLFDKYLYVGSTRAATYLGVGCRTVLPAALGGIRGEFIERW